ncbi:MAG: hypothetical protein Q8K46_05205, partial [Deltaproteobacteria bacterium]|nr:hypothetical protein [Deltaproteobacteria bacterium]
MTINRISPIEREINNVKIRITEELEHWLKKNFSSEIDEEGRIIKLRGIPIEEILEDIVNNLNVKTTSIILTEKNLHLFDQITQERNC